MIERSLFEYLVNSLWQLPLLVCAAWLLIRIARPPLIVQHALWLIALLFAVMLPLRGTHWNSASAIPETPLPLAMAVAEIPIESTDIAVDTPPQPTPLASRISRLTAVRTQPLQLRDRTIDWLIGLYGISIAFSLARLVHGYLAARRMVATAVAHPLTTLESTLVQVCASRLRLAASRIPEIRFLDNPSSSPLVIGVRHPTLLLPACLRHSAASCFNDRNLTAVLSHELAHIRRRDYLVNLIARVVSLPIAYHPATHALHRRIRQTREMICDAHAAGSFESASTYARSLLAIADRTVKPLIHIEAVGFFDHTRNTLEERIMNLTAQRLPVSLALRAARIATGTAVLLAAISIAATLHIKPAAPSNFIAPAVYAARVPQSTPAPQPAPAPQATPAPSPTPKAHHNTPTVIVNGEVRELTPEERQKLEKDLGTSMEQIQQIKKQFDDPAFKKQLADSMKVFDSAEFKKQMEDLKINLKGLDDPEFRKQIADAQKLAMSSTFNDPKFKIDMDQLKLQLDSPEFRAQMEQAKNLAMEAKADAEKRSTETRQQLDEARQAIEEVKKEIHDAKLQQQLEQAQRNIQNATPKD